MRALRTAGAAYVLVTLSPVPDAGASAFMQAFYRHMLEEDITPAQALRATKLDYINSPDQEQQNPTAWAPYQLIGGYMLLSTSLKIHTARFASGVHLLPRHV